MKNLFHFNGQTTIYKSEWVDGRLWIYVNGRTLRVEPKPPTKRGRGVGAGPAHGQVQAPMPGKVTKVLVEKDKTVTKGQALIVMEAMKMEYTLKAEVSGSVEKLLVQVGAQVALGDILAQIRPEKSGP
jgi:biotin carboxyl carrier protein